MSNTRDNLNEILYEGFAGVMAVNVIFCKSDLCHTVSFCPTQTIQQKCVRTSEKEKVNTVYT